MHIDIDTYVYTYTYGYIPFAYNCTYIPAPKPKQSAPKPIPPTYIHTARMHACIQHTFIHSCIHPYLQIAMSPPPAQVKL